jgi:hypothetical protein
VGFSDDVLFAFMKEVCATPGAPLKTNDCCSKTGDNNFYETAMNKYNKSLNEYDTLHFGDGIVLMPRTY